MGVSTETNAIQSACLRYGIKIGGRILQILAVASLLWWIYHLTFAVIGGFSRLVLAGSVEGTAAVFLDMVRQSLVTAFQRVVPSELPTLDGALRFFGPVHLGLMLLHALQLGLGAFVLRRYDEESRFFVHPGRLAVVAPRARLLHAAPQWVFLAVMPFLFGPVSTLTAALMVGLGAMIILRPYLASAVLWLVDQILQMRRAKDPQPEAPALLPPPPPQRLSFWDHYEGRS